MHVTLHVTLRHTGRNTRMGARRIPLDYSTKDAFAIKHISHAMHYRVITAQLTRLISNTRHGKTKPILGSDQMPLS